MNRKTLVLSALIFILFFTAQAQQVGKITPSGIGYLEYLPDGYHTSSADYPVVISLHGIKEKGTSSTDPQKVMRDLPRVANVGLPKYVKQGKKYPFILISPQLKSQHGNWPPSFVIEVLNHVKKTLRVDEKRIYLTGLSLGGFGVWRTAGAYPEVFAAIAPICAGGNSLENANAIAKEDVATWGFHGDADKIVSYTVTTRMVNAINAAPSKPSPLAKVTIFPGMGHIIWDKAYHETNVLSWMLTFRNGSSGGGQPSENTNPDQNANKAPVANAGADKTMTLPSNSVALKGSASDSDGEIASVRWTKVSGGDAQLSGSNSTTLTVSNLVAGTYVFRLTAQDDDGATDSDEVAITVKKSATENTPPVANAGADRTLTLPRNSTQLQGTGRDEDGSIVSYKWSQVAGPAASIGGDATSNADVNNLKEGSYVFRLTVKDDRGASASDDVRITVSKQATANNSGNGKTSSEPSQEILPQSYPGPVRNNGQGIDYTPISDKPWVTGH